MPVNAPTIERWTDTHPRWAELMAQPDIEDLHLEAKAQPWHLHICTLVALDGDALIGILRFWTQQIGVDEDKPAFEIGGVPAVEAKVVTLHVDPGHRQRGVGRALQIAAARWARELGCYQVRSRSAYDRRENHLLKASLGVGLSPGRNTADGDTDTAFFVIPLRLDPEIAVADGPTRDEIDAPLARKVIAEQFSQWSSLPVTDVEHPGWDNKMFRLGDAMSVRMPSAPGYAAQVEKEHRWLPTIAPQLPVHVPTPLAKGAPSEIYPWAFSIYPWLPGENAFVARIDDHVRFATDLARFQRALYVIDASGGPLAGPHSCMRGCHPDVYLHQARRCIAELGDAIDGALATEIMEAATASRWEGAPVWVHGDIAPGNLLVTDGALSAVIDFGCSSVGDPSCDLVIAWTMFDGPARAAYTEAMEMDAGTWARARAWALWKALLVLTDVNDPVQRVRERRVYEAVTADHVRATG